MPEGKLVVFSLRIVPPVEKRWALLHSLNRLVAPTRVAPGCLDSWLYTDFDDRNAIVLVEEWESREEFEKHLSSDKLKTLISAIELSSEAPEIHIDIVARENGLQSLGDIKALAATIGQ